MSDYLDSKDSDDEEENSKMAAKDPEAIAIATAEALELKAQGNAAFAAADWGAALTSYTSAVNILKKAGCPRDSLILLNRSATYLALKRYVPAHYDATQAAEVDESNWKAHWRQGVALGGMTQKSFRAKQAIAAFDRCLKCPSLPENKRAEVSAALAKAKEVLQAIDDATPMPDMSNCAVC